MRLNLALPLCLVALALPSFADAKPVKFAGMHPRTGRPHDGLCFINAVHVHPAAPPDARLLYRVQDGVFVFVGDPVPFGYDGPKHQYYGHHPVNLTATLGVPAPGGHTQFCYLDGPHFHVFAPPEGPKFEQRKDVYYYTDPYPPEYEQERPELVRVNAVYHPLAYARPVVVEPPPPAYHGPIVDMRVNIPVPTIGVSIGAPVAPVIVVRDAPPPMPVIIGVPNRGHMKVKHMKHKGRD